MFGPAEACCCVSLQRHSLEYPGAKITHKSNVVVGKEISQPLRNHAKMQCRTSRLLVGPELWYPSLKGRTTTR